MSQLAGAPGGAMALTGHHFHFNLDTSEYESGTVWDGRYYRLRISVWDNANGLLLGADEVTLE
ncbi:MAG: hypothetical protein ACREXY_13770, partial [Gammaproteobacteria bacterium]